MIFLVGPHGVGKSTAGPLFTECGFEVVDTGPLMRQLHARLGGALSFGEWVRQGEALHGLDFTNQVGATAAKIVLAQAAELGREAVLLGFRSLRGIRFLLEHAAEPWERAVIVGLHGPSDEELRQRWMAREGRSISSDDFHALLAAERAAGLEQIYEHEHHTVVNDCGIHRFIQEIRDLSELLAAMPHQDFNGSGMVARRMAEALV